MDGLSLKGSGPCCEKIFCWASFHKWRPYRLLSRCSKMKMFLWTSICITYRSSHQQFHLVIKRSVAGLLPSFSVPFQRFSDHLEQGGCEVKMKIDLILTKSPYNLRSEFVHQTSGSYSFRKDEISEMVEICGDYLSSEATSTCFPL